MLDKLLIKSEFMRSIVSKLIERSIKNKYGCEVLVELKDLDVVVENKIAHVQLSAVADVNVKQLSKLMDI